jgi:hypothetical protein
MTTKIDGEKEFKKSLNEYLKWNKRQCADIINAKLYFIGLNAMTTTKTADKSTISMQLMAPSKTNPEAPLAAILVNKQLVSKGKKGVYGQKLVLAIDKFVKKAISKTQFLRSGYITAIKKLDFWNRQGDISFVKRFAPKKPSGVKQYGSDKGDVLAARPNNKRSYGWIWNKIGKGKQASPTVDKILNDGLGKAVRIELSSMNRYIDRKMEEKIKKLNSSDTYK